VTSRLTGTAVVAQYSKLCCRIERPDTMERQCGGESVSQLPLKDKAFLNLHRPKPTIRATAENWRFVFATAGRRLSFAAKTITFCAGRASLAMSLAIELNVYEGGVCGSARLTNGRKTSSRISLIAASDNGFKVMRISWRARSVGSDTIREVRRREAISPRSIGRPRWLA
jgi:hypothetical protein